MTLFKSTLEVAEAGSDRFESVEGWVDTGAYYSQLPAGLLQRLGYSPSFSAEFVLADGQKVESPIGDVVVRIGRESHSVVCVFGEDRGEVLIGATTLELFRLAADPVRERLIPSQPLMLTMRPVNELEEGAALTLDFDKLAKVAEVPGVVPCAVQDADTHEVILVAYVNQPALQAAIETRSAVFWSTSRNELWEKGKTSGETFDLVEVRVNCEQNSLLYIVRPRRGGICHTKNEAGEPRNCFYRRLNFETGVLENTDP